MERRSYIDLNWRDAEAYACLLDADRSLFAWEWLRRDPAYRAAARITGSPARAVSGPAARRFGLVRFEDADASVPRARPLWRSDISRHVLVGDLSGAPSAAEVFEVDRFWHLAHRVCENETDHLLLTDGLRAIRLDAPVGAFDSTSMCLRFRVRGLLLSELSVLALRRLLVLVRHGRFSRSLHRREARAPRWILQLRTYDALASGADLREIAEQLLGRSAAGPWRTRDPSLRSQAQRMVRSARALASGGFRQLLGGG